MDRHIAQPDPAATGTASLDPGREAAKTLAWLRPRLEAAFQDLSKATADPTLWPAFSTRLDRHFPALFAPLFGLYGDRYDFLLHLEELLIAAARSWAERPAALRSLDEQREGDPAWFQSERMIGGVCYVDRYAGDLAGVRDRIPDFQELGLTYLHLMPLFQAPAGENDGGYAVSSYRDVNPSLGSMADLAALAADLRAAGISLVLDFVFNHTSNEHAWAAEARAHPDADDNAYLMYPDRSWPDAYERTLREIFPEQRPGSFTWEPGIGDGGRWVWTTFNSFQWDLRYASPTVFRRMAAEMLFLANQGVEILRLDAVAFVWKRLGTACESLPEAHLIVRAYNALARIAAPALLFKSEAIVHPDEVAAYIAPEECQLSYNPLLMALLWETLATRETSLLRQSLAHRFAIAPGCAWVNYVRSHDDIGWTFDDADAAQVGKDGFDHRRFLNRFYTGRFPGSFARGVPFQENPRTGDARISGTAASLAGLEKALRDEGPAEVGLALGRIALLYGITILIGGIPLLYLGDELATLNHYGYLADPAHTGDSRWVHRPRHDSAAWARRRDPATIEGRLFARLRALIDLRTKHPTFAGAETAIIDPGNDHVFGFVRSSTTDRVLVLANVTEAPQSVAGNIARLAGFLGGMTDLLTGDAFPAGFPLELAPYRVAVLGTNASRQ